MSILPRFTLAGGLVATSLLPYSAFAAEPTEIIVVTASQQQQSWLSTPASIDIARRNEHGLLIDSAELLQGIPGLQVDSRANFAQDTRLSLRGFGSRSAFGIRGIYLQQDGIPISAPDGQGQLSSVLLDNIAYAEVLRGPMAVLYGNGAGGVISLYTNEQQPSGVSSDLALSSMHQQYQLQISQRSLNNSWQLAAKHFETEGFRERSSARKQQIQFGWQSLLTDELTLRLRIDGSNDPLLQDPLSLSAEQWREDPEQTAAQASLFDTTKSTQQHQASLALAHSGQHPWQVAIWQGNREVAQNLAFTGSAITSSGGVIALDRDFQGANAQKQWQLHPELSTLVGAAFAKSDDARQGYVNQFGQRGDLRRDETNLAENRDLYWRVNYQPTDKLSFNGGLRYTELYYAIRDNFIQGANPDDSGERNYYQHAGAIGMNYQFAANWAWFMSTGQGFEAPTLSELAYKTEGSGLNLGLEASENRQWETGVKYQDASSSMSLSVFSIRSSDELLVASSNNGRTSYRNAGDTARDGIELAMRTELSAHLQHDFSLTLLDATFASTALSGKRLPGVAKTDAYSQLRYQPRLALPLYLEWISSYRSKIATDDENSDFAPSAVTFDAAISSEQLLAKWQVRYWLKVNNLTDRKNVGAVVVNQSNGRAFEPAPGRYFSAGVNLNYRW
ncbi:MAG: TonB-dependent receptor [Alishewanella sp.]|nr:TonB-dependent receptor [Alishewanella sp.]